jgi:flavodoxin
MIQNQKGAIMKKLISILLVMTMMLSLAACGAGNDEPRSPAENAQTTEQSDESENNTSEVAENNTSDEQVNDTSDETAESDPVDGKKILVVYFSSANTTGADVVSAATPEVDGLGSTGYLAQLIHDEVGGDLRKITPETDYPTDYNGTLDASKDERDNDERPGFTLDVNPEDYDVIFVGYPIWWYTLPMVMYTFFDNYDLSGKTIIPFNTHGGSRDGGTYDEIAEFEPDATVLDGLAVSGTKVGSGTASDVKEWLEGLNY